ncbi:MAG: PulJ/GspJ family protein [Tepidisphaeraceae bacterium]
MSAPRKGFMIAEMLVTIGILIVVVGLAMRVFASDFRTGWELSEASRREMAEDRALQRLRRDVESATQPRIERGELVAADVRWHIEKAALVRLSGDHVDRYEPLPVSPVFTSPNGLIVLHIGEFEQAFAPIAQGGAR